VTAPWRAVVAVGVLGLALAGCSVEVVDDDRPSAPAAQDQDTDPQDTGAPDGAASPRPTKPRDPAPSTDPVDGPGLPGRADLRPLTTAQTACAGGDAGTTRAAEAAEVTDACGTLTVAGAGSVVVAGDVTDLVVQGAGARVAVRSAGTVTIDAADVTVTWESGTPVVTDLGAGSTYGQAGSR
jgi:DUF3060 family protein